MPKKGFIRLPDGGAKEVMVNTVRELCEAEEKDADMRLFISEDHGL